MNKKKIAFIFKTAPHGSSAGREGLDALLAASSFIKNIGVFFISDGVFQVLKMQKPSLILSRDYISTFKLLPLYNVELFVLCKAALLERGFLMNNKFILKVKILTSKKIRERLENYNIIMSF